VVASPSPLLAPVMTTTFPSMLLLMTLTHACCDGRSAAGHLFELFGIACPLHRGLGDGAPDVAEIIGHQLDTSRPDVLLQPVQFCGAGDRHDPRLLSQQPGERDLGGCCPLPFRDLAKQVNKDLVRLPRFRREAGNDIAEIGAVELCVPLIAPVR
jgi:hypothetical protein